MKHTLTFVTALLLAPLAALHAADASAKKPNILVILADDLGCTDLGWQGRHHEFAPTGWRSRARARATRKAISYQY